MATINAKAVLVVAPLIVIAGLFFFARVPLDANYWTDVLPGIILMAGGMAAVFVVGTVITTNGVSHKESGLVSGLLNSGQQIGGALGLAVLTVISTAATKEKLATAAGDPAAVPAALLYGFHQGFMAAAVFALGASVVALLVLKATKPTKKDLAHEAENEAEALPAIPGA